MIFNFFIIILIKNTYPTYQHLCSILRIFAYASTLIPLQRFRPVKERVRHANFPYHMILKGIDGVSTLQQKLDLTSLSTSIFASRPSFSVFFFIFWIKWCNFMGGCYFRHFLHPFSKSSANYGIICIAFCTQLCARFCIRFCNRF